MSTPAKKSSDHFTEGVLGDEWFSMISPALLRRILQYYSLFDARFQVIGRNLGSLIIQRRNSCQGDCCVHPFPSKEYWRKKALMAVLSRLRLIQFRAAYNLPVLAAVEYGIFARHGLEVEVAYTPGSDFLIAALEAGKFEIGHTAADDVVAAVEGQARCDLFLFMGLHSGLLSLVAGPGRRNVESLRGQSLGVDSKGTGFVFLLTKFLRSNGLRPEDYALTEIGGWEQRCRALLEKRIAATLLTSPYVEEALECGCYLLARGNEIEPVYQATCGAATRTWARQNQEIVIDYIRGYLDATRWCFDPPNR
ncbi:MAG: ABC transporter substrate-binding protein, partial [Candidatus Binatia bacterium]